MMQYEEANCVDVLDVNSLYNKTEVIHKNIFFHNHGQYPKQAAFPFLFL